MQQVPAQDPAMMRFYMETAFDRACGCGGEVERDLGTMKRKQTQRSLARR